MYSYSVLFLVVSIVQRMVLLDIIWYPISLLADPAHYLESTARECFQTSARPQEWTTETCAAFGDVKDASNDDWSPV
ncbi:hypothetical protein ARMGADRAFT_608509 [Armillaria gallica]|uniref:Uncharacterized protein n=1 Tax=Armillaria gallica TaxID=47427 RepID=A0A2H3D7V4_ARMGA|nr:hypothetical protein ARMGADRAFT_608509 [Armillaria gallica]